MGQEIDIHVSTHPSPSAQPDPVERLRRENVALRNRMLAHAAVAAAQGILKERYRLASLEEGSELLRRTSQRHNVKLHTFADAVIRIAGPDERTGAWLPHRARAGAPPLPGLRLSGGTSSTAPQGAVLGAGLRRVLEITEAAMGNVQLAEGGLLRLEKHSGLGRQSTDFFAFVDHSGTACARAARDRRQVTIRDVATATAFDEDSRHVILRAGSRACHSVPLLGERGALLGVIPSHHARSIAGFTRSQLAAPHETADVVGRAGMAPTHRHPGRPGGFPAHSVPGVLSGCSARPAARCWYAASAGPGARTYGFTPNGPRIRERLGVARASQGSEQIPA
ncbi:ANTAR domain-containing protein [Streptomyces sp. NPDC052107]|uniref:ANTAR domain-containing protein n=1 Tax=Streptomyces sp. NPDC052107 TaxID=3155632 RepID=UPI00343A97EE